MYGYFIVQGVFYFHCKRFVIAFRLSNDINGFEYRSYAHVVFIFIFRSFDFMSRFRLDTYSIPVCVLQDKRYFRDHSAYRLSKWETTLHCNVASHWLSPYSEWSPILALVRSYVDCLLVIWRTLEIIISTNYPHTKIPHLLSLFGCSSTSLFQSVSEFICYVQPGTVCWKIRPYGRQGLTCLT